MDKDYFAFVCYSSQDEEDAKWLVHELEQYHLSVTLNGKDDLPKGLRSIFRDDEDFQRRNLPRQILQTLANSKHLIVVCSLHSASSLWVNKVVEVFIHSGRTNQMFLYNINAIIPSDNPVEELCPPALRSLPDIEERLKNHTNQQDRYAAVANITAGMLKLNFERYLQMQSRFLAGKANELVDIGDSNTAIRLLLAVLPDDLVNPNRPYTPEAECAFRRACERDTKIFRDDKCLIIHSKCVCQIIKDTEISGYNIRHLEFSSDGKRLIGILNKECTIPEEKKTKAPQIYKVSLWNLEIGKIEFCSDDISCSCMKACLDNHGNLIVAVANKNSINIYNETQKAPLGKFMGHSYINDITFDNTGKHLASASYDKTIRIWEVSTGACVSKIGTDTYVGDLFISSKQNTVISSSQSFPNKGIKIWNIAGGKPIHTLFGFRRSLRLSKYPYTAQGEESIEMIYENAYDDVMYEDSDIGKFHSWDEEEKLIEEFCPNIFCHPSISNDGKRVVSLADDHFIRVWDVKTEKLLIMFDGPDFSYAHFSPDGNYIVATSEHSISIHDSFTGVLIRKFDDDTLHFRKATFSPDGRHVAAGTTEGAIYIWDFPSLQELINDNRERFKDNPLTSEERRRYFPD